MLAYGVTESGNFEGSNILHVARTAVDIAQDRWLDVGELQERLNRVRGLLLAERELRVKPGLDDKVLAGWNGMMLAAFAEAARVLGRDDYRVIAERNAEFLLSQMRDADGRMLRTWKAGHAKLNGYLEDYANVADGLLELYQTTFEPRWFEAARDTRRADPRALRRYEPAASSTRATTTRRCSYGRRACRTGRCPRVARWPPACWSGSPTTRESAATPTPPTTHSGRCGAAWSRRLSASRTGSPCSTSPSLRRRNWRWWATRLGPLLEVVRSGYRPNLVVAAGTTADSEIELLQGREEIDGRATAYLCREFSCQAPTTDADELRRLLDA